MFCALNGTMDGGSGKFNLKLFYLKLFDRFMVVYVCCEHSGVKFIFLYKLNKATIFASICP